MVATVLGLGIGVTLFVAGVLDRPAGVEIGWGWGFGFLENSTFRGKIVGLLGTVIFFMAVLFGLR